MSSEHTLEPAAPAASDAALAGGESANGAPMRDRVVFFIGRTRYESDTETLPAATLIRDFAGQDPAEYALQYTHANQTSKYAGEDLVELKNGMHLSLLFRGPLTVS